jgi:hypothetical protein
MDSVDNRRTSSCQGSRWLATVQLAAGSGVSSSRPPRTSSSICAWGHQCCLHGGVGVLPTGAMIAIRTLARRERDMCPV